MTTHVVSPRTEQRARRRIADNVHVLLACVVLLVSDSILPGVVGAERFSYKSPSSSSSSPSPKERQRRVRAAAAEEAAAKGATRSSPGGRGNPNHRPRYFMTPSEVGPLRIPCMALERAPGFNPRP
jgi:hypothetical protein